MISFPRFLVVFVFGLLLCIGLCGQCFAVEEDTQLWVPITFEAPIHSKWRASVEIQPRITNDITKLSVLRIRPSITYVLKPHLQLTTGYLYSPSLKDNPSENRFWQQVQYSHDVRQAKLHHQLRFEERFIDHDNTVGYRGRYLSRIVIPTKSPKWFYVASQEFLYNVNGTETLETGLGQSRSFIGVRRKLNAHAFAEAGYLLQWVNHPEVKENELNHVIIARLVYPLWTKIKDEHTEDPPEVDPDDEEPINPL